MNEIKRFQIRGVPGEVKRVDFNGRIVDYWLPKEGAERLLIAHDGQNVFDGHASTHRNQTWEMAQSAIRISQALGIKPPAVIGVWHSGSKEDPWGRGKDLVPEKYFRDGIKVDSEFAKILEDLSILRSDEYLTSIFDEYVPSLAPGISVAKTAMIGSSMGALATLYALAQFPDRFKTALALSPHWPFGGLPLVEKMITALPVSDEYKVWMSHGTKGLDSQYAPFQQLADKLMYERGYLPHNFVSKVYERSGHNERSWAKYLDQPMRFWLST
jgi:enterochelin esterase-like enzyme